jgi:endonuclease/exonuclease/phosphatase family metal-dependent hydrolase
MMFSLLTLNAGLLRLFGSRIQPAPFVAERLEALPDALLQSGVDLIALQEVYEADHRSRLQSALAQIYGHVACSPDDRRWGLDNGLMLLSKHKLTFSLHLFEAGMLDERLFARKGVLAAEIELDGLRLGVFNVHTTAGGAWIHPEDRRTDRVRAAQITELLGRAAGCAGPAIIVGDLNAGPKVSEENYRLMERGRFVDAHAYCQGPAAEHDITWDPKNPLNSNGPHRKCPPQRIDHVFVRAADMERGAVRPLHSEVAFREPCVPTSERLVTLSDHFGVRVSLELGESATGLRDRR